MDLNYFQYDFDVFKKSLKVGWTPQVIDKYSFSTLHYKNKIEITLVVFIVLSSGI